MTAGLPCKHRVQFLWVKADHDLLAYDNGWSGATVIGADQLKNGALVRTHVLHFKLDPFLRKVGLSPFTRRSTRLTVNNYFLLHHLAIPPFTKSDARACAYDSALLFHVATALLPVPTHENTCTDSVYPTIFSDLSTSISVVMLAVLWSMAETAQYFSFESRTASSAALRETRPEIV